MGRVGAEGKRRSADVDGEAYPDSPPFLSLPRFLALLLLLLSNYKKSSAAAVAALAAGNELKK